MSHYCDIWPQFSIDDESSIFESLGPTKNVGIGIMCVYLIFIKLIW